jgi:hypothetical protein
MSVSFPIVVSVLFGMIYAFYKMVREEAEHRAAQKAFDRRNKRD